MLLSGKILTALTNLKTEGIFQEESILYFSKPSAKALKSKITQCFPFFQVAYKYVDNYYTTNNRDLPKWMKLVNRLPVSQLVYIFSIGMDFQLRVVYPHLTNKFIHKMMNIGSGGRSDKVAKNYAGIMMGL